MVYRFITFIYDDSVKDLSLSFRDGPPEETFYNYFTYYFSKDEDFLNFYDKSVSKIASMSKECEIRMRQLEGLREKSIGVAFFKIMRFYHNNDQYRAMHGKHLMIEFVEWK